GLRFLLPLDAPAARLAVDEGGTRALPPFQDDAADAIGAEAEDGLVAELPGVLAERPERPVAQRDDGGLIGALGEDLLLGALRGVVADEERLGGLLAEVDRDGETRLVETGSRDGGVREV